MFTKEQYEKVMNQLNVDNEVVSSYEELLSFYNQMKDMSKHKEYWNGRNKELLCLVELYCLYYGLVSLSIKSPINDSNFKIKLMFSSIFSTMANSILAVINLSKQGFDFQSMVLIRQFFEMGMILLNVSIDENKAKVFTETQKTSDNLKIWRKNFSPSKLNETIANYEGDFLSEWREDSYGFFSNYAHSDYLSFMAYSFALSKNENDYLTENLWGSIVSRRDIILGNILQMLWYISKAFLSILSDQKTYVQKEKIVTEYDLWNSSFSLFLFIDKKAEEYITKNLTEGQK